MKKTLILIIIITISVFYLYSTKIDKGKANLKIIDSDILELRNDNENDFKSINQNGKKKSMDFQVDFNKLADDKKRELYRNCSDYFYFSKNGVDFEKKYIDEYYEINSKSPSKMQVQALLEYGAKCDLYLEYSEDLKLTFVDNDHMDSETGILSYHRSLITLRETDGIKVAISEAETNLFNIDMSIREAAKSFLVHVDWIKSMNQDVGITNLDINESRGYFSTALNLRECELGLYDCSMNSFNMLRMCQQIPESCGVNVNEFINWTMTGYENELVEKYLRYIREL